METELETLLRLVAEHDCYSDIFWDDQLKFYANCGDVFYWGCADAEQITEDDIGTVRECFNLVGDLGLILFAAVKRGLRPQNAYYKSIPKEFWKHFDECGEERQIDNSNPSKRPTEVM